MTTPTRFPKIRLSKWQLSAVVLAPASILIAALGISTTWAFGLSLASMIPLAAVLGNATQDLAGHLGPAAGGLLNASLGNAAELILGLVLLARGQVQIVKASLSGSIIGNLLLVFGLAAFLGGLRRRKLSFSRAAAGASNTMLFLAVVALIMPAFFALTTFGSLHSRPGLLEVVSFWTAAILLLCYFGSLVFAFRTNSDLFGQPEREPRSSVGTALWALVLSGAAMAIESDIASRGIEAVTHAFGWTDTFLGVVVLATVGNAAEHSVAVRFARQNKMDLALSVAMGSSTQIALFVAPLLVMISRNSPTPMTLVFPPLEIVGVILSVVVAALVSFDGETNWLEGLQLLSVYAILALFFYFVPS